MRTANLWTSHSGVPRAALVCAAVLAAATGASAQSYDGNGPTPPVGEFCPPGSRYDGANCHFGSAPAGTNAFLWDGNFYHSPLPNRACAAPATFDGANCFLRRVPSGYRPFIYRNGWYVGTNARFLRVIANCPERTTYDGTGCDRGAAPAGRTPLVLFRQFLFTRRLGQSCGALMAGATGATPLYCSVGSVPKGYDGFAKNGRWYVKPKGTPVAGPWRVKTDPHEADPKSRLVCRTDAPARRWQLAWSDEFSAVADNTPCYTGNDQIQCVEKPYWGWTRCAGQPAAYSSASLSTWTSAQTSVFGPLRHLNKCTWQVFDSFNTWDATEPEASRLNSFVPGNVRVEGGVLKLTTRFHGKDAAGYDCGRPLNATENNYTRKCPFSGASLWSISGKPWTNGNSPTHTNPDARYSGKVVGYGRIEFRAKIAAAGHGAWPAVWLFVDERLDPAQGVGELDALEYLAHDQGDPKQLVTGSATFGNAIQTAHNWGVPADNYPHTSEGVGIPISVGEWRSYSIDYEPGEVRFYIDGCLRNRIVEGQPVTYWNGTTNAWETKPFRIPKNQYYTLIIGNPASNAGYLPSWYRAWTDKATGTQGNAGAGFRSTELHVDYVRYYTSPDLPVLGATRSMRAATPAGAVKPGQSGPTNGRLRPRWR